MLRYVSVGLGVATILLACGSEGGSTFSDDGKGTSSGTSGDAGGTIGFDPDAATPPPPLECKKMDIVFVVDNSSSMDQEQAALASNFPSFIKLINEYRTAAGDQLDYRVAIVSTDLADGGAFRRERGASPAVGTCGPGDTDRPWLERHAGIESEFSCRAQLGVLGANRELPLECTRLGLTDRITDQSNTYKGTSFIREDALLALVVITDEDDGGGDHDAYQKPSPIDVPENYVKSFDQLKGGFRGRWATAIIAGEKYCLDGQFGTADQAVRLQKFADLAKPNSVFSSICSKDFTTSLKEAFDVFANACKGFPEVR
jgi:hypothetical protein